jgi:hypothetical protein
MRGSTFVILAAIVIVGLLAYFYLLPKFRQAEEGAGEDKSVGVFQERQRALEEEAGE